MSGFFIYLRGMAMGAADIIPGVSGGTIALITGIYARLVESIRSLSAVGPAFLLKGRIKEFIRQTDLVFLLTLIGGVATSILLLSRGMTFLLHEYPEPTWGFFFGLILSSSVLVARQAGTWKSSGYFWILLGAAAAYGLTSATPAQTPETYWFLFLTGMVAICAMILPGISGSFILVLFGKYLFILEALHELKWGVILIFCAGCAAGLLSFSHLLSWLLKRFEQATMWLLCGFMLGSLNKVWPWKHVAEWVPGKEGEVPRVEANIFPGLESAHLWMTLLTFSLGLVLVLVLDRMARKKGG